MKLRPMNLLHLLSIIFEVVTADSFTPSVNPQNITYQHLFSTHIITQERPLDVVQVLLCLQHESFLGVCTASAPELLYCTFRVLQYFWKVQSNKNKVFWFSNDIQNMYGPDHYGTNRYWSHLPSLVDLFHCFVRRKNI